MSLLADADGVIGHVVTGWEYTLGYRAARGNANEGATDPNVTMDTLWFPKATQAPSVRSLKS